MNKTRYRHLTLYKVIVSNYQGFLKLISFKLIHSLIFKAALINIFILKSWVTIHSPPFVQKCICLSEATQVSDSKVGFKFPLRGSRMEGMRDSKLRLTVFAHIWRGRVQLGQTNSLSLHLSAYTYRKTTLIIIDKIESCLTCMTLDLWCCHGVGTCVVDILVK